MYDLFFLLPGVTFFSSYQTANPAIVNQVHLGVRVLWHPENRNCADSNMGLGLQQMIFITN